MKKFRPRLIWNHRLLSSASKHFHTCSTKIICRLQQLTPPKFKQNVLVRKFDNEIYGKIMTVGSSSLIGHHHLPFLHLLLTLTILHISSFDSVLSAICDFSLTDNDKLYNYNLASPSPNFPHGVLSEDGFYKVAANGTILWFQLCDLMIFNHDPPACAECMGCGTPRCGMGCSALVSHNIGGYHICTTIGHTSNMTINVIDEKNPNMGVIVKMMSSTGPKVNCSLSVSVICDSDGVQGPQTLEKVKICDYATQLRHPYGCAKIEPVHGKGLGWFGTFITIILCLFGAYLLGGTVYRFFFLHIRGIDVIPNLEFWASLPHRAQSLFTSTVRRFRGPSEGYRSSYSPVNF